MCCKNVGRAVFAVDLDPDPRGGCHFLSNFVELSNARSLGTRLPYSSNMTSSAVTPPPKCSLLWQSWQRNSKLSWFRLMFGSCMFSGVRYILWCNIFPGTILPFAPHLSHKPCTFAMYDSLHRCHAFDL